MSTPRLPIWTIILDLFGTLLVVAGIFLLVSEGDLPGQPAGDLRGLAIGMIVVGVMVMVPLILAAVRRGTTR